MIPMIPSDEKEKYPWLRSVLRETCRNIDAATNDQEGRKAQLMQGIAALNAVIFYLGSIDPELLKERLLRPLTMVSNSLFDAEKGAVDELLDHDVEGSKPTGTMHETVQPIVVLALELLVKAKMGTEKAAREVAAQLRKAKITDPSGSAVTWERIVQWRKDISVGRAPVVVRARWEHWRNHYAKKLEMPHSELTRPRNQAEVRRLVAFLATFASKSMPKARHRK
jgi:hypothetical protein